MKKVYATTVIGQAEMLQVVLRRHGIESRLENEGGALYAVGLPSAAAPIVIVVDDERAEEATRIIAEEFSRPKASDPTAIQIQLRCACGKTLEYPKGEDPPDECPWCGRPTQISARPEPGSPEARKPSRVPAPVAVIGIAIAIGLLILALGKLGKPGPGGFDATDDSPTGWARKLKERIAAIPDAAVPPVDPDAIAAPLMKEYPEETARFSAAVEKTGSVEALADRWNGLSIELSPDWAMEHGFADSPRLSRYSIPADQKQILLNALVLRKLRAMRSSPPPLDGRLFERHLERILLSYVLFGTAQADPRPAFWGILACRHVLDRPALLAERLEQVPEVVREFREHLAIVPRLWILAALEDSNSAMMVLRDIEQGWPTDSRLAGAVRKARDAISDFVKDLRTLQQNNSTTGPRDPRWTAFLVRDMDFSGRTPRDVALSLVDEATKSFGRWRGSTGHSARRDASYAFNEWLEEVRRLSARTRERTLERGFAEVPPGDLPVVKLHPHRTKGNPEWPSYAARPFEASLRASLWVAPWDGAGSGKGSCSSSQAFLSVAGEAIPGRHLQNLLARRDGTLLRRLYWSWGTSEGWREYSIRWALDTLPDGDAERSVLDGVRFRQCWSGAVELCYLAGTLTEAEALEMLQGGLGDPKEDAEMQLAWATLEPLFSFSGILGERDIVALREETKAKQGAAFDLKRFHTRLMGYGHTPVALLREEMLRDAK